jgi:2-oxoglutarate dehydrogenase E1 component
MFGLAADDMLVLFWTMQASDNTRHRAFNPSTEEAYLLPPREIRRVILCTGQVYYQLSLARRARRIRDIVLVRLEQIAPFPSDLMIKVASIHSRTAAVPTRGHYACLKTPQTLNA